jgi:hypothetical protein
MTLYLLLPYSLHADHLYLHVHIITLHADHLLLHVHTYHERMDMYGRGGGENLLVETHQYLLVKVGDGP